eukprot:GILK01008178.1.p1 GENE.GILK01008178.1~~GILK01008178.1.p1  ORF type:complete len:453 (-),score=98.46 GILK01008178.1:135-1493(-)
MRCVVFPWTSRAKVFSQLIPSFQTLPAKQTSLSSRSFVSSSCSFSSSAIHSTATAAVTMAGTYSSRVSIAPMMDITDKHYRYFMRLLTRKTVLWTEMVVDNTILHNKENLEPFLGFHEDEHPVVAQLGGSDPVTVAESAKICEELGYDEVNLNCGCPSDRVSKGCFGARLMYEPTLVRDILKAVKSSVAIPATVKCRLGVDDKDTYEELTEFIRTVAEAGVTHFIIHARKAWLKGLSPLQNRTVPPLKYEWVYRLVEDFPHLMFSINGGINTYEQMEEVLDPSKKLIGVMLGRAAYNNPWMFADIDRRFFGTPNIALNRREVLEKYAEYAQDQQDKYRISTSVLTKPLTNLFYGQSGTKVFRQRLDHGMKYKESIKSTLLGAIAEMQQANRQVLEERPPRTDEEAMLMKQIQAQKAKTMASPSVEAVAAVTSLVDAIQLEQQPESIQQQGHD